MCLVSCYVIVKVGYIVNYTINIKQEIILLSVCKG